MPFSSEAIRNSYLIQMGEAALLLCQIGRFEVPRPLRADPKARRTLEERCPRLRLPESAAAERALGLFLFRRVLVEKPRCRSFPSHLR